MKIALIGYGKMGRAVERTATGRGHLVAVTVDNEADWLSQHEALNDCDIAIGFSTPATAVENMLRCFDLGLPVVEGTTGWYDRLDEVCARCTTAGGSLFWASNFSIGMNVMFELNRRLASLMAPLEEYDVRISETHHIHKLDAPSGTAITLAGDIITRLPRKNRWTLADGRQADMDTLQITAHREGEVPGVHEVVYDSAVDTLTLRHEAKSRAGLALGAVLAAEYLLGRKGVYTMHDMLAIAD